MEFIFKDTSDLTEKELIELLDHNTRCAAFTRREIDKLRQATTSSDCNINVVIQKEKEVEEIMVTVDTDFEEEADYYLSDLRALPDDEIEKRIGEVLPARKNNHYKEIIMRLSAEMVRDIKEIDEIIVSDREIMCETDIQGYEAEKAIAKQKLELLNKRLIKTENTLDEEDDTKENDLIFVTTESGNPRVLSDLKSIPQDYYPGFIELFDSIKDGTFKNVSRFVGHEKLLGASEVKDFKIRVVFIRLTSDKYAILTAFMKKVDNDTGYRNSIIYKLKDYNKNKTHDKLLELIKNPEFIKANKEIEKELYRMLGKEEKENNKQKVKKGDKV